MKKYLLVFSVLLTQFVFAANPTELNIKVYQMAVSTNTDCSDPTVVFTTDTPETIDMLKGPNVGGGDLPQGTYPCLILTFDDLITFKSDTDTGSCKAGTTYTLDVCQTGSVSATIDSSGNYGAEVACTTDKTTPEKVTLFLSTKSTIASGNANTFRQPTGANTGYGLTLNGAWVVGEFGAGTFVVNGNGKVIGTGNPCDMQPPVFGFR